MDESVDNTNYYTATAEALKQALHIGAVPVQLSSIQMGPWCCPDEKGLGVGPMFSEYAVYQYGMVVNPKTGKRFTNELADRKRHADLLLQQKMPCVGIVDNYVFENTGWDFSRAVQKGVVRAFQSIEELCGAYSIPVVEFQNTLNTYNQGVLSGEDKQFGKLILQNAKPIQEAPFYAMRVWPKVHHVGGGIGIDEYTRVYHRDGGFIQNLYAAGEVTGGLHGANRLGSCALTECFVFGRIAGTAAAQNCF